MQELKLNNNQKNLRKRIIEISYKNNLSHIGSCLNAVDLIDIIYKTKKMDDIFILSAGHSAVALYAVLEKYKSSKKYDEVDCIHPDRLTNKDISVSTGSLGQGLPIAIGTALSDKNKNVYCLISDGECAEGSIWEAFRIICENNINNLIVVLSANSFGAYGEIDKNRLKSSISGFGFKLIEIDGHNPIEIDKSLKSLHKIPLFIFANTTSEQLPFLQGQNAHYYVMSDDLASAQKILS